MKPVAILSRPEKGITFSFKDEMGHILDYEILTSRERLLLNEVLVKTKESHTITR